MTGPKRQLTDGSLTASDSDVFKPGPAGWFSKYRPLLILLVFILVTAGFGTRGWLWDRNHVQTDNAFVEASIVQISARVPGMVERVLVKDNQFVHQGDLLIERDESDYRIQVKMADAGVCMAQNESGGDVLKAEGHAPPSG